MRRYKQLRQPCGAPHFLDRGQVSLLRDKEGSKWQGGNQKKGSLNKKKTLPHLLEGASSVQILLLKMSR